MGSDNSDSNGDSDSQPAAAGGRNRPNEIRLSAGRIEVEVQGFAGEQELMNLASKQMERQMKQWVEVDRQVVSTEPEGVLSLGGDR